MQKYERLLLQTDSPSYQDILGFLVLHGYERIEGNLAPGQYSLRGDVLKINNAGVAGTVTVDFWGDRVERLRLDNKQIRRLYLEDNRLLTEDGTVEPEGYLVHPHHGIGRFKGRITRDFSGQTRSFLLLEYAGGDQLFFPREREGELMPYYGRREPRLTRLHSAAWERTKRRIARELVEIAKDLLTVQAERKLVKRAAWPTASDWQKKLSESFPHILTDDQEAALADCQRDLQGTRPMDRLLTGDVGFGKTEVAIRVAAAVMAGGGQVVVLAPTTVLAEQHWHVWRDRFASLPVVLARAARGAALTPKDKQRLQQGQIDCLIGTHKLLAADLKYRQLGLAVIDEEQRFGVVQKEHFKRLRSTVDILSLSATPIPRTLYFGLAGLREMSIIRTAPGGRQGVETHVSAYNPELVKRAVMAEISRGGQIYYVHNRVKTLPAAVSRLRRALQGQFRLVRGEKRAAGELRFAVAHGRMDAASLTAIMHRFFTGQLEILITTAIIEHGLDNPRANTLIVERAEHFGLADLYQLRGRVGRRRQKGQALLLIGDKSQPRKKPLPEEATERLRTIADAARLGSGWSIALKDLEIRGAGSLLGSRQHGNMEAIGLVLYGRLLKRVVAALKSRSSILNVGDEIVDGWKISS